MKTGLAALISPMNAEEFFSKYSANEPFLLHHDPKDLWELTDLPFLQSLEALLQEWPHAVQAHLPDLRDEVSSIDTNIIEARKNFNAGMGLLFNDANRISPVLQEWVEMMKRDLGFSSMTYGRSLIYATPHGKGTAPHFDQNINFVLQIRGIKKWKIATNQHVVHPMTRHTMGIEADPEMLSYLETPLPTSMPKNATEYVLRPGSLLFVPRGCWHETEADGDALALNFTFTAPTWIDLLTAAIRARLVGSVEWRETADGVSDIERRAMAETRFDQLLTSLIEDLPNWRAEDILGATDPDVHATFRP